MISSSSFFFPLTGDRFLLLNAPQPTLRSLHLYVHFYFSFFITSHIVETNRSTLLIMHFGGFNIHKPCNENHFFDYNVMGISLFKFWIFSWVIGIKKKKIVYCYTVQNENHGKLIFSQTFNYSLRSNFSVL